MGTNLVLLKTVFPSWQWEKSAPPLFFVLSVEVFLVEQLIFLID